MGHLRRAASLLKKRFLALFALVTTCRAWQTCSRPCRLEAVSTRYCCTPTGGRGGDDPYESSIRSRRSFLSSSSTITWIALALPTRSWADSSSAEVTDRVFFTVKGLSNDSGVLDPTSARITIGLFGQEAPSSVNKLKRLFTQQGLSTPCRPRAERMLQKEQLEANKVYNRCKENEEEGVSLKFSTIWRVIKDERIDVGAVSGGFIAREYPEWNEAVDSNLKHDTFGVVSVRKGNDGGFGFSIYTGVNGENAKQLDSEHIVVGRVIEGLDLVRQLNNVPVITSAKINYMAITGGPKAKTAPDRSCTYGGPMYCNENKPLVKLSLASTGVF